MITEKKKLLNLLVIQGCVCFLIPLWGAAMIVAGLIRGNLTWMVLGFVVICVGLPFAGNALQGDGPSGERRVFPD